MQEAGHEVGSMQRTHSQTHGPADHELCPLAFGLQGGIFEGHQSGHQTAPPYCDRTPLQNVHNANFGLKPGPAQSEKS